MLGLRAPPVTDLTIPQQLHFRVRFFSRVCYVDRNGRRFRRGRTTNADQQNTLFGNTLNILGIKHYLARVNRPQTNGKAERFFLSYKTEFITETFTNVKDYVRHYNEERPHMSLLYKTPKQVWEELKLGYTESLGLHFILDPII